VELTQTRRLFGGLHPLCGIGVTSRIDFTSNGAHHQIGASVGIAPVIADAERDVLAMADAACYAAKSAGRGRVVVSGD